MTRHSGGVRDRRMGVGVLRRDSLQPASVTAPMIAAVVTVVSEYRRGYHDNGRRWPIGVTGTRNGNGDASGGRHRDESCKNYRRSEVSEPRPHSPVPPSMGRGERGVYSRGVVRPVAVEGSRPLVGGRSRTMRYKSLRHNSMGALSIRVRRRPQPRGPRSMGTAGPSSRVGDRAGSSEGRHHSCNMTCGDSGS